MKIAWIRIKGFQQFEDTFIDFRHPKTGKALDKICLIGRNGTGKSTILQFIYSFFQDSHLSYLPPNRGVFVMMKIVNLYQTVIYSAFGVGGAFQIITFTEDVEKVDSYFEKLSDAYKEVMSTGFFNIPKDLAQYQINSPFLNSVLDAIHLDWNSNDLLIYCPSESFSNDLVKITDVPETDLNWALGLFNNFPSNHEVSNETIKSFWLLLIYLIKKRENDRSKFENDANNIDKTKKQLIEEFDSKNPDVLKNIAELWDEILGKAGLRFDYENAKKPIQLSDNLFAYIVNKNGTRINYNKLSTGVRNFIFRFGHIMTLYFNREIKRGFLLVDEPENSLFPDFLLNIIEQYKRVTTDKNGERNTQMFFATHSPIIASQFEPHERIILDWDEDGSVKARKGTAPEGDDPNDILYQDFGMTEIVSKKGQEIWKSYLDLKKRLNKETNDSKKKEIAEEILRIGREYNFN